MLRDSDLYPYNFGFSPAACVFRPDVTCCYTIAQSSPALPILAFKLSWPLIDWLVSVLSYHISRCTHQFNPAVVRTLVTAKEKKKTEEALAAKNGGAAVKRRQNRGENIKIKEERKKKEKRKKKHEQANTGLMDFRGICIPEELPDFFPPGCFWEPLDIHSIIRRGDFICIHLLCCDKQRQEKKAKRFYSVWRIKEQENVVR